MKTAFFTNFALPCLRNAGILAFFLCLTGLLPAQKPRLVVPIGHTGGLQSVAFSPGGKYILTGSRDKTAILWDLKGHETQTFKGHTKDILSVAFSPDGQQVLTGSEDSTAILWDLNGRPLHTFRGHSAGVESVAFSSAGNQVLTGSRDGTARLWDLAGTLVRTFAGHKDGVNAATFSPNGQQVLTGSRDGTAILWNLDGQAVQTFRGHTGKVKSVAFSPDGQQVLTGSEDKTAKLWSLDGTLRKTFSGHTDQVNMAVFSPDGTLVGTSSHDRTARLWNLNGESVKTIPVHRGDYTRITVAFSPAAGRQLLTGSVDGARLWDLDGNLLRTFSGRAKAISAMTAAPVGDGGFLLAGSVDGSAGVWDLNGRDVRTIKGHTDRVGALALVTGNPAQILTGSEDGTAKLWDLQGKASRTFTADGPVTAVVFSPAAAERQVLVSSGTGVKRWTLAGVELQTFTDDESVVNAAAFSAAGGEQRILTGSDNTAMLWGPAGQRLHTFSGHSKWVSAVAFSPDGSRVLTGSVDGTAKLWNPDGTLLQTFAGHSKGVRSVAFSPDGSQVLTGSVDGTAKLWAPDGRLLFTLSGHGAEITSVAFLSAGGISSALTGSMDNTVKLWNPATGKERATLVLIGEADWVVTTPAGQFDASDGAMQQMYYLQERDVVELEQLKGRYWAPGLLSILTGFSKRTLPDVSTLGALPLYPDIDATVRGDQLHIRLTERGGGLGKLVLLFNGKAVQPDANPEKKTVLDIDLKQYEPYYLPEGNTIALRAFNKDGWLKSQAFELSYQPGPTAKGKGEPGAGAGPKTEPGKTPVHLYALLIGTAKYGSDELTLTFPDSDARAMEQALQGVGNVLFTPARVHLRRLSTDAKDPADLSTKANIAAAFKDFAAQAKATDIVLVFFSGHGKTKDIGGKSNFYYLTKDVARWEQLDDPATRNNATISDEELSDWLVKTPAKKQVLIFDACNSGTVVKKFSGTGARELSPSQILAFDQMRDRTGMFILTGSAADKVSFEASRYGQGLLTRSLLEGMSGAALDGDRVDVAKLLEFACRRVPELAADIKEVQKPEPKFPDGGSFSIGIKNGTVNIPLPPDKPVFIRGNFQDNRFGDELNLTRALEQHFHSITVRGADADLSYMPVEEFNDSAYSIRGRYSVDGEAVQVEGVLFKGGKPLPGADFKLTGVKSDVPGLAEAVVEAVWGKVK